MKKKRLGYYLIILILGAVVGSVLGDVIGLIFPEGVVKKFFLNSHPFGINPVAIDLAVIKINFGFTININIIGVLGIIGIAYLLRWME